ncbi:MAG: endonuclease V [Candidatus Lokiarchaeota archaeon]|nr:endonuclease V [Candidatus Lokiarchaeota archaeon]
MTYKNDLLRKNYTFEQAELIQNKYQHLIKNSRVNEKKVDIKSVKTVTGVDISYYRENDIEYGIACAVGWNMERESLEEFYFKKDIIRFPYKPGFLGFRECRLLAKVLSKLQKKPDLILCDGHGKIHPRRFGEAVHLGFALNLPTIGVAKNFFIGYSKWNENIRIKGSKTPIWANETGSKFEKLSNELIGYAVYLKNRTKPVFISEGYKINIESAVTICLTITKDHRQPEPLYLADYLSRKEVKKFVH